MDKKEFYNKLLERDKSCKLWRCLSDKDRHFILENYYTEFMSYGWILDPAHIIQVSKDKSKEFDENNVFILCRFFHRRLDSYKHPVTNKRITKEQRLEWLQKAKDFEE